MRANLNALTPLFRYHLKRNFLLFLLLAVAVKPALALPVLNVTDPSQPVEMGAYARYFEGRSNSLTYRQIAPLPASKFEKSADNIINLGYSSSRIWLKVSLENRTAEMLYAFIEAQEVDYIDAYVVGEDTSYYRETGALRPFANRNFAVNSVVLNLGVKPAYLFMGFRDMNGLILPVKIGTIRSVVEKVYR